MTYHFVQNLVVQKLAPTPYEKMEGPGKSGNEYKKKP